MTPDDGTEAMLALLLDLQARVLGQEDALAALRRERDAESDAAADALRTLRQALAALEAERAAARQQIAGLEAELARIHASRAWRLTAPLRRMRGWLKGRA